MTSTAMVAITKHVKSVAAVLSVKTACVTMSRDTNIHEEDILHNAHSMRSKTSWAQNPEPDKSELDPQVILDTEDATADAYLWKTTATDEGWLAYKGETVEIKE